MNGCASIAVTESAQADLLAGYWFYEQQQLGIGTYFLDSLFADIDSLQIHAGVHYKQIETNVFRALASKFPYAIYYKLNDETIATVIAVLDTRRDPVHHQASLVAR